MHRTIDAEHAKKRDILTEKRESVMVLEKLDFPSESGNVDTYDKVINPPQTQSHANNKQPMKRTKKKKGIVRSRGLGNG